MTIQPKHKKQSAKELVPPLIIATVGIVGVVVLYFLSPGVYQPLELVLLVVAIGLGALGYRQRIVRGIMTAAILYVATGVAGTFYETTSPLVGAFLFSKVVTRGIQALSFCVLAVIMCVVLEFLGRRFFKDTSIPGLGILDNLGGMLIYLVVGVLVAALLFNAIGYGDGGRGAHNAARLRPQFNQVLYVHYLSQSFWFKSPPPLYVYDMDLSSER